jgi:polyphosphate kinase 2 (PPK2 family)
MDNATEAPDTPSALPDVRQMTTYRHKMKIRKLADADSLSRKDYDAVVSDLQLSLVNAQRKVGDSGLRVILVFEGMDAAGKGGAIKRLIQYLDPRGYRVHSLDPPGVNDRAHHFLRRFWTRLPKPGRISIFDDYSWYARLLLETIEGYCTPEQAALAPRQIREFERTLVEDGYVLLKFWIQVSREEQHRRFRKRLNNPYKAWKLTPEDWRNRERYDQYLRNAQQMIDETDTSHAPWFLVPGNDKLSARITVLQIVTQVLDAWPAATAPVSYRLAQLKWLDEHEDEPPTDDDSETLDDMD